MTDSEMQLSDDEDYDLEYDSNSESEPDVDLENQYYHAKSVKVSFWTISKKDQKSECLKS